MMIVSGSSQSLKGMAKVFTYGFTDADLSMKELATAANRIAISGAGYKDEHRKASNIARGSNVILIDCDEEGQAAAVEARIQHYDFIKVPSASNLKHPYKWHYFIPTQETMSIYPAAYRWQVEQFFMQVGITEEMIDTTGSYDPARQFAPASIGMTAEEADELTEINDADLQAPVMKAPEEFNTQASKSVSILAVGTDATELPVGSVWYDGKALTYPQVINAVNEAHTTVNDDDRSILVSGFGCPHNNHDHTGDVTRGYGFAFKTDTDEVVIKCSGNACKDRSHFIVPDHSDEIKVVTDLEPVNTPVDSIEFANKLKATLQGFGGFVVSQKMMEVFATYGSIFNTVVNDNTERSIGKRHIVPMSTGSAKTTAAKLYMAISNVSGIIVVREAKTAIELAHDINEFANDDVARCYYSIDTKNGKPNTAERTTKADLTNWRVIVITHKMFLDIQEMMDFDIDVYRLYKGVPRQAVIIDERINMIRSETFSTAEVYELIDRLKLNKNEKVAAAHTEALTAVNDLVFKHDSDLTGRSNFQQWEKGMRDTLIKGLDLYSQLITLIESGSVNLIQRSRLRGNKSMETEAISINKAAIKLLQRISYVCAGDIQSAKQGQYSMVSRSQDYSLLFGSVVILDATANIYKVYDAYRDYQEDKTIMYEKIEIRNYQHARLHIAKGIKQSKQSLYGQEFETSKVMNTVKIFLDTLYPLVGDNDNMLVVVHKDALPVFQEQCKVDNITFINWGKHAGSNEWSHYNKAAVVGWYRIPQYTHANSINAAAGGHRHYQVRTSTYDTDVRAVADSMIADDMIQFLNRTRSRKSIDEDGNCKPVDFYIFSDNNIKSQMILKTMIDEMPNIQVHDWRPVFAQPTKTRKSKMVDRADRIIERLKRVSEEYENVYAKTIMEYLGTTKDAFKKTLNSEHFKKQMDVFNITIIKAKEKGNPLVFDLANIQV